MGLDMTLYVNDPEIARNIREGYTREGKTWSTVAVSTGRNWHEECQELTRYFIQLLELGQTDLSGFTGFTDANGNPVDLSNLGASFTAMTPETLEMAYEHMDEYVTEASEEQGLIAYWYKATHIHAWFDRFYKATVGNEDATIPSNIYVGIPALLLVNLLKDCNEVVQAYIAGDYQEVLDLMDEKFPLTGELYEHHADHKYTRAHVEDIFQTGKFLAYLLCQPGAFDALYTYNPWY